MGFLTLGRFEYARLAIGLSRKAKGWLDHRERKSVLSRILEEGSANSYGLTKETCLAVYLRNLGKRSGWSRSVSEAVCVLSNDGVWRR